MENVHITVLICDRRFPSTVSTRYFLAKDRTTCSVRERLCGLILVKRKKMVLVSVVFVYK